jgi:mono/diheme cytochrome c family protein
MRRRPKIGKHSRSHTLLSFAMLCVCLLLGGCERAMHDMYAQPKYKAGSPSPLFADGSASRPPPQGSIPAAQGELAGPSSGRLGHSQPVPAPSASGGNPYPISLALLRRGRERYDIDCAPCHGLTGAGDGMVVQRGFPRPPPLLDDRWRHAADADLERVIRDGYGLMYPFGGRIDEHDRWAIVAYLRALELSQRAPAEQLAPQDREALAAGRQASQ